MSRRLRWIPDASEAFRPLSICVVAIVLAAGAMSIAGSPLALAVIAASVAVFATFMILQIKRAIAHLLHRSVTAHQAAAEAEEHYVQVLLRVIDCVEARDRHWSGHSENVGRLAERIATELHLDKHTCRLLNIAGRLHDIGIVAAPESLRKEHARFAVEEFRAIQAHSSVSYDVLKPLTSLAPVLPAIRHHHERINGTGYPDGLKGDRIPLGGRILAVADAYDAMTHDRPQRSAMTPMQAIGELRRCCPAGYDTDCVEALARAVHLPTLEQVTAAAIG